MSFVQRTLSAEAGLLKRVIEKVDTKNAAGQIL